MPEGFGAGTGDATLANQVAMLANQVTMLANEVTMLANLVTIYTQTNKIPNIHFETKWMSTPAKDDVASANATNLTECSITPVYPTGATKVRFLLVASIHVSSEAANAHHIGVRLEGQKGGAGYTTLGVDFIAETVLSLVAMDGSADGKPWIMDVSMLVDESNVAYNFRFVVDSDNAGAVTYVTEFALIMIYTM